MRETKTDRLITQRSQVRILSPLLSQWSLTIGNGRQCKLAAISFVNVVNGFGNEPTKSILGGPRRRGSKRLVGAAQLSSPGTPIARSFGRAVTAPGVSSAVVFSARRRRPSRLETPENSSTTRPLYADSETLTAWADSCTFTAVACMSNFSTAQVRTAVGANRQPQPRRA